MTLGASRSADEWAKSLGRRVGPNSGPTRVVGMPGLRVLVQSLQPGLMSRRRVFYIAAEITAWCCHVSICGR